MIEFSNPAALWLLTLIIPILVLYLLKRKRRDIVVPSLLIWKKAIEDSRAQTPFQKLRSNLLLFLQILAIVLMTALLSQPHTYSRSQQTGRWILAIDASASMQSTDAKPDRFREARKKLLEVLDSVPAHDEVMLVSFSAEASVLQPLTTNHDLIRTKLQDLKADDVGTDWARLGLILKPLLRQQPRPRIVIASDFARFSRDFSRSLAFDSIPVGESSDNLAVTRASLRPAPENPAAQILFYQITNLSPAGRQVDFEVYREGQLIDAAAVQLAAGESLDRSKELTVLEQTKVEIRVVSKDALALDNDFTLFAEPTRPISVQIAYPHPILTKALRVIPLIQPVASANIVISQETKEPAALNPGIIFVTASETDPPARVIQWNRSHPSLRFVDAALWKFSHCQTLLPPPDAEVLLETDRGTAAFAVDHQGSRTIVLGFDLDQSNLVLFAGFPILLQNALHWIEDGIRKPLPILTDDQSRHEGEILMDQRKTYLNFADADESSIAPQKIGTRSAGGTQITRITHSLASYFLILLIAVVMLEWWTFHRRLGT